MGNEIHEKKNILKSKIFLKLFFIPYGIWFILLFIAMTDKTDSDAFTWGDFFIGNIVGFVVLFIIAFSIALLHAKKEAKDLKMGRTPEKKWQETSTFKKIRFPLIMSIITFLIGLFLSYDSVGFPLKVRFIILLIAYIPFILFLIFVIVIYKNKQKKKVVSVFKIISIIFTFLLLHYYFVALFLVLIVEAINPMTNPKYYSYHIFITPGLKKVFPSKIPKDVENVKFFYAPGVLQGGTRYMLYYVDKNMTLDQFDKKYQKQAEWIGHQDEYTEPSGLLNGAFYGTPAKFKNENDYIIYLIDGRCDDSGYCNHGAFLMVAFNEKTHEVVYSTEQW